MNKTKIIAEIGWNHLGDIDLAKKMISSASKSGADYAKFQTWSVKHLIPGPWDIDGRLELYKKSEITEKQHEVLIEECKNNGIKFLTSIFNAEHVDFLSSLGQKEIKVASMEINNQDLLKRIDENFEKVFISTGASNISEIETAKKNIKNSEVIFFHCVSIYPTPAENINLPRISEIKKFSDKVGYSGHYNDIDDAVFALNYGVDYIEKHFTIDNSLPGRDNKFSLNPDKLKKLCNLRDNFFLMNKNLGINYQTSESDVRNNYRGRWSKK